jgi:hypothetical protein
MAWPDWSASALATLVGSGCSPDQCLVELVFFVVGCVLSLGC